MWAGVISKTFPHFVAASPKTFHFFFEDIVDMLQYFRSVGYVYLHVFITLSLSLFDFFFVRQRFHLENGLYSLETLERNVISQKFDFWLWKTLLFLTYGHTFGSLKFLKDLIKNYHVLFDSLPTQGCHQCVPSNFTENLKLPGFVYGNAQEQYKSQKEKL